MARTMSGAFMAAIFLALMAPTQPAHAAENLPCACDQTCAERADPSAGLAFDDEKHRYWYAGRFWRGQCHSSLWWCFSGDDWYDVMSNVLAKAPGDKQPALCTRIFNLGQKLGHEWARANDARSIHTDDLKAWQSTLLDAEDPFAATTKVEVLVAEHLN